MQTSVLDYENPENAVYQEKNLLANIERFVTRIRMVAQ
jgi:hypothetical protein